MKINFFEEYPTKENMAKLDFINWPSTIFIAAPSLKKFESTYKEYADQYPHITFGWWPIIPESYWVSGLANPTDLDLIFSELTSKIRKKELPVLIDFELPIKKHLYFKNIFHVSANKRKITNFFIEARQYNLKIYSAEYPYFGRLLNKLRKFLGISQSFDLNHTKIIMFYSSMGLKFFEEKIWNIIKTFQEKFAKANTNRVAFGLGTIATGILGNEPSLSPQNLKEDISWAKKSGIKEIFIFRLGGLNKSYSLILQNFIQNN